MTSLDQHDSSMFGWAEEVSGLWVEHIGEFVIVCANAGKRRGRSLLTSLLTHQLACASRTVGLLLTLTYIHQCLWNSLVKKTRLLGSVLINQSVHCKIGMLINSYAEIYELKVADKCSSILILKKNYEGLQTEFLIKCGHPFMALRCANAQVRIPSLKRREQEW